MIHAWLHEIRLWLWRRQERMLARSVRPTGTSEGDWIGANVAASAASSGAGGIAGLSTTCSAPAGHDGGSAGSGGGC